MTRSNFYFENITLSTKWRKEWRWQERKGDHTRDGRCIKK
jgi:hypothetical protein